MQPEEIQFYESSLSGSTGGTITGVQVQETSLNNLFKDIAPEDLASGTVAYAKIFLKNLSPTETLSTAKAWVLLQPTDYELVEIALGTDSDTDGSLVAGYVVADSQSDCLALGDIAPLQAVSIWLKKTTVKGTPEFQNQAFMQLAIVGA